MSNLDPSKIAELLAKDATKPKTTRARKDKTEPRTYDNWWKQPQEFGQCTNPDCIDEREPTPDGTTIVAPVKDGYLCRYCFLAGVDSSAA